MVRHPWRLNSWSSRPGVRGRLSHAVPLRACTARRGPSALPGRRADFHRALPGSAASSAPAPSPEATDPYRRACHLDIVLKSPRRQHGDAVCAALQRTTRPVRPPCCRDDAARSGARPERYPGLAALQRKLDGDARRGCLTLFRGKRQVEHERAYAEAERRRQSGMRLIRRAADECRRALSRSRGTGQHRRGYGRRGGSPGSRRRHRRAAARAVPPPRSAQPR